MARAPLRRAVACALVLAAGGGACSTAESPPADTALVPLERTLHGRVVYALESEPASLCLPEVALDASGATYARAIYDTLTAPNASGAFVANLAAAVEPNATFDRWLIRLRPGIVFHDGSNLDAAIVKDNLDAARGAYPARVAPPGRVNTLANIAAVDATDPLTVVVTTATPWPSLPAALWDGGRLGIMARTQLDDAATCATRLIGTGPFKLDDWTPGDHFSVVRNEHYWQRDAAGIALPYLDAVELRAIPDAQSRVDALVNNTVQVAATSTPFAIEQLRQLQDDGSLGLVESGIGGGPDAYVLNATTLPFSNEHARAAFAHALDRQRLNDERAHGVTTVANGPFSPDVPGYVSDTDFPEFDLETARAEVAAYEAETGQPLALTLAGASATPDAGRTQVMVSDMLEAAGMDVAISPLTPAVDIAALAARQFSTYHVRLPPIGDADQLYGWWHCTNPAPEPCDNPSNTGGFNDAMLNGALEQGRAATDPARRAALYEDANRQLAAHVWIVWLSWPVFAVASALDVHGLVGPPLPDGSDPYGGLGAGLALSGLWIEQ